MSLVMGFLCDQYVLLCGDTQINYDNEEKGLISKVYSFNKDIVWGFTGNVNNNIDIIRPYLNDDLSIDQTKTVNITFDDLCGNIYHNYYIPALEKYKQTGISSDLNCFIGGYKDGHFLLQNYTVIELTQYEELLISESGFLKHRIMGKTEHESNLKLLLPNYFPTIQEMINIFQNILDIGITFDTTINNYMTYVYLEIGGENNVEI